MAKRYRGLTLGGLLVLLVLAGTAFFLYLHFRPAGDADFELKFSATDILGRPVSTEGSKGKVLLVNVFATWCPPCKIETPHLVELYKARHDSGLDIVMVSDEPENKVTVFAKQFGIPYPVIANGRSIIDQIPGFRGYPTTIIIDRKGAVRHPVIVGADVPAIRKAVDKLLKE